MAFGWVIRHQKKALFLLAAVLIVGWGIGGIVGYSGSHGSGRDSVIATVAGETVTWAQFQSFRRSWATVFPEFFRPEYLKRYYGDAKPNPEEIAWAWYGLWTLARHNGIQIDDAMILEQKRQRYHAMIGRNDLPFDENAERFFAERVGVSSRNLDEIVRQFLMARYALYDLTTALESTGAEAWEDYARENRAVRVRVAAFPASAFLAKVPAPDNAAVQAWYDAHKGASGDYYNPPAVQIEYAQLMLAKLEADVVVSTDEMKAWYEANKDLYKISEAKDGKEAQYVTFPEVKPEIEGILKRKAVGERAAKIMDDLRAAFAASADPQTLEDVLKSHPQPAVEFFRTPFVSELQLMDLPGIGSANAEGAGAAQLAYTMDSKKRELSPVLGSPEGRWVMRPVAPPRPDSVPELAEIRARVVDDLRRNNALKLAGDAAAAFDNAVTLAGASRFDSLAAERGLVLTETPFFVNRLFDASRPDYIDRVSPLQVGGVYGPWASTRDGLAAVVKVVEERLADRAGFAGEEPAKRAMVLATKMGDFPRVIMPRGILGALKFKPVHPEEGADNATKPVADNAVKPAPDNATKPVADNATKPAADNSTRPAH